MLLLLLAIFYVNSQFGFKKRDLIEYNDLLHRVETELNKGTSITRIEDKYECKIILATGIEDPLLAEEYRNSAFVLDLHNADGEYIGKVCWRDELNNYDATKKGFLGMAVMIWAFLLVVGYMMAGYFHREFIKPVRELQHFSEEIAKGNLDEPLPIHKNNVFGNFVEAFDLMREQLVEAKERDINSQKARKELITELSHDIKTPVSVIKATCEVLEAQADQGGKEISRDKIAIISQKADTISELISNMMHANLEDLEQLEVRPTEEVSGFIPTYLESLKQYGNIIIDNEIPGCIVYMDRIRMEQAIDNVVSNSYKYAHTDIHVSFDTYSVEIPKEEDGKLEKAHFLRIRIRDEGPGVPDEELPLLCEKYYRESNASEAPGSGLGFYLVKYYMEKQGGGLEYYNDDGFVVELLLRKV
jgi:signal transduction histidine kinase